MGADGNDVLIGGTGDDLIITGSVANENSSWTSTANTTTFGAGIYSRPTDNDAALLLLITQWSLSGDRSSLTAITNDATLDLAWGHTGNDDFSAAANEVQDFNASGMSTDEAI